MKQLLTVIILNAVIIYSTDAFEPIFDGRIDYCVGGAPTIKVIADLNQDGIIDIATNSANSLGYLHFIYGDGNGTFDYTNDSIAIGYRPYFVGAGQFNADNDPDFAVICQPYSNDFYLSISNGDGTYTLTHPNNSKHLLKYYTRYR